MEGCAQHFCQLMDLVLLWYTKVGTSGNGISHVLLLSYPQVAKPGLQVPKSLAAALLPD
jgi:hypothetical protein